MSTSLPATQLSLITTHTSSYFTTLPVPTPGKGEVLIKNIGVASNPKDYKVPKYDPNYEYVEGNDVAGIVVRVGEGVQNFKEGDRVAAFSRMMTKKNEYGGYQEYTVAPAVSTFHLGPKISYEDAATLPLAAMTAAMALFLTLKLPEPPVKGFAPNNGHALIVYGASTSVGVYTSQLAKRAGFYVVGVAGDSAGYAKENGADIVLNYKKESDLESALIKACASYTTTYGYDTIALQGSGLLLANVLSKLSPSGKGKITSIGRQTDEEKEKWPRGIEFESTWVWTCYEEDKKFGAKYYSLIGQWLSEGSFKPNKVRLMPNGLASAAKGVDMLKNNEVHAEKLVYLVADTPQLKGSA